MKNHILAWMAIVSFLIIGIWYFIWNPGIQKDFSQGWTNNSKVSTSLDSETNTWDLRPEEVLESESIEEGLNNTETSNEKREKKLQEESLIVNKAWESWDITLCETISQEDLKIQCIDNASLQNALENNDKKFCVKIKNTSLRAKCSDNFIYNDAISKKNSESCKKINDIELKENCLSTLIFEKIWEDNFSWSINICKELSKENKEYCISQITQKWSWEWDANILEKALKSNKIEDCMEIKNISLAQWCKDTINIQLALENKDETKCDWVSDVKKKESCKATFSNEDDKKYFQDAIDTSNIALCEKIKNISMKNQCKDTLIFKSSIASKDKNKCSRILDSPLRSDCEKLLSQ